MMNLEPSQPFPCEVFYLCAHREECNTFGKCSPEPRDWAIDKAAREIARD